MQIFTKKYIKFAYFFENYLVDIAKVPTFVLSKLQTHKNNYYYDLRKHQRTTY